MAVVIFGFWNVPVVRNLINPLKLFAIGWHELCHICAVRTYLHARCAHGPRVLFMPMLIPALPSPSLICTRTASVGHPHRRAHPQNHDRPTRRRRNDRRGRQRVVHALRWLPRQHAPRRHVRARGLGHARRQDHELRPWGGAGATAGAGEG